LICIALLGLGVAYVEAPAIWDQIHGPSVTTCFTPAQDCVNLIVGTLNNAQSQIRLQAYGFTSPPILSALVAAERRGVDVVIILDKSDDIASPDRSDHGAEFVARAGIPVFIDYRPAIAHNKVIVVDKHIVVTGSYNFTGGAEHRNAENVTVIASTKVAGQFLSNWQSRRAVSRAFVDYDR
jgi:phosphatidylserine/phosphatidylglycerophosphate/cardiolipin synthase-like enzyme